MSAYKSDFLQVLAERGFIHQVSEPEALDAACGQSAITAYIGFDCTAASLHVGSLLPIMMLHWMQQTGHRPIALMGGGTTRVGDPSGKDESRKILTDEDIDAQHRRHPRGLREIPRLRRRPDDARDGRTTPTGSTRSTTSSSCATSAGTSRSTGCCRSTRSSCGSSASSSCRSSNSTT